MARKKKAPPKAEAKSSTATTIEFLKPSGDASTFSAPASLKEGVFPPTVFSDVVYSKGIRVFPESLEEKPDSQSVSLTYNHNYTARMTAATRQRLKIPRTLSCSHNGDCVPLLTLQDSRLWHHKRAARSAVQQHFPMPVFRLLGVITREVTVTNDAPLGPFTNLPKYSPFVIHAGSKNQTAKQNKMGLPAAKTEAKAEGEYDGDDLEARATEIQSHWNQHVEQGPRRKGWDAHGQLPPDAVNDDQYIPLTLVRDWLKKKNVSDPSPSHKSLYNGLRSIPNDLETIVASLLELSSPDGLYNIPLILPHAVMEIVEETRTAKQEPTKSKSKKRKTESIQRKWRIRIGVYANRLLPEVMTSHDLHIVMTALDAGSYRVVEPLHLPPSLPGPVFESAPTPIVVMDDESDDADMSDSDGEEKKSDDVVDMTIEDSTRDESRISAFTIKGFLKLLENKGNDISNWPTIEPIISPVLKLELMLHQQHAICWMLQMESLGGFGINSIVWEEREFLDGGKYYYSPALGQIRLAPPHVMKGGILADEQGLGKTLEVLGLIIASLDELKHEAAEARKESGEEDLIPTHATLIIVPPALVSQWKAEIRKAVGDALVVQYFNPKSLNFESEGTEEDPDIVITTYAALQANNSSRTLSSFAWGRIVLDEMQEIRTSTTKIAKNCDNLICERRWMISGTPLFDGLGDLRGELNFLRLEPYSASTEDGFFDFSITNHWMHRSMHGLETLRILGMLILRRSKSMTIVETRQPLLGLKPLTVEFVPIPQDPSERAVYCFLESIVSRVLNRDSDATNVASRTRCLRVLREMCISSILLSGGLGAPSQLGTINGWMIKENRRLMTARASREGTSSAHGQHAYPFSCHANTFSCEEAIQYLSSAHENANVGDEFVTDQRLGFGGGGSNRNRAAEDFETQLKEAEETVSVAIKALKDAKSKKARARWHLALEKITTGQVDFGETSMLDPSIFLLWKMRSAVISSCSRGFNDTENMPSLLVRGWRPSESFMANLFAKHPTFAWAHPVSYQIDAVPSSVSTSEVRDSILAALQSEDESEASSEQDGLVDVVSIHSKGETWRAILQFANEDDLEVFRKTAATKNGIALASKSVAPTLQAVIDSTQVILDEASEEYKVLPSTLTQQKLSIAQKEHDKALLGLRIVLRSSGNPCHLRVTKALRRRSTDSSPFEDLYNTTTNVVAQCNLNIRQKSTVLQEGNDILAKLRHVRSRQVPDDIKALTVFETLCALSKGEKEKTKCPICLCNLGVSADMHGEESPALVAMTHCGHVFCADCLKEYAEKRHGQAYNSMCCPSCRRSIDRTQSVILVDTEKTEDRDRLEERRQQAKALVQKVARLLDESNGQLDSQIWEELYLAIDLPPGADSSRLSRFNAIPGGFLGHLRGATKLKMDAHPTEMPQNGAGADAGLSSKIRALLADLPRGERSVVFTESKAAVKHLTFVLEKAGIGCRALFSSQAISAQEVALEDWKSTLPDALGNEFIPFPVLCVQSGAAASGLTLTASSKMFILEPMSRMEEEQQAYARCHRYGQENPVHVKCYVAPVSVESRLLEWRKRASERPAGDTADIDTKIVYSPVATEDVETDTQFTHANENEAEQNRTNFLLALTSEEQDVSSSSPM